MSLIILEQKNFQDIKVQKYYDRLLKLNQILDSKELSADTINQLNVELKFVKNSLDKTPKEVKNMVQKKPMQFLK